MIEPTFNELIFTLPSPPSTNALYRNGTTVKMAANAKPKAKTRRFKSTAYKAWRAEAGWMLNIQRLQQIAIGLPEQTPCSIVVSVSRHTVNLDRDGDNFLKPTIDLLKSGGVIIDDNFRYVHDSRARLSNDTFEGIKVKVKWIRT